MNNNLFSVPVVAASTFMASQMWGQTIDDQPSPRIELRKTNLDQFRVSCRLGFNISAHLESSGGSTATPTLLGRPIPESVTGITYRDGYVGRDVSGNAGGLTWYWGYANNNQYVGDNILLSYDRSGTLAQDFKNDPQVGLEAGYSRQLGERNGQKWGIEAAFSYLNLDWAPGE